MKRQYTKVRSGTSKRILKLLPATAPGIAAKLGDGLTSSIVCAHLCALRARGAVRASKRNRPQIWHRA